jgi:hypothetical protein
MKPFFILCLFAFLSQTCIYKKIDRNQYLQTSFFQNTQDTLQKIYLQQSNLASNKADSLKVGFSKINITPNVGIPLAGYSRLSKRNIESILDSAYIRVMIVQNSGHSVAFICSDLLIFPMELRKFLFATIFNSCGLQPSQLYFTATHTHHGQGGWGKKVIGRAIAGKYSYKQIRSLGEAVILAIQHAQKNIENAQIRSYEVSTSGLVFNRLQHDDKLIDTLLRVLEFKTIHTQKKGLWVTFSAHATSIYSKYLMHSSDYPGKLVETLENKYQYDWAGFSAGGVASHSTSLNDAEGHEKNLQYYADTLAKLITTNSKQTNQDQLLYGTIRSFRYPIYLKAPQYRLSDSKVLAPWLFYSVFGNYDAYITVSQIGNTVLVGTPCDFSGQLTLPLAAYAKEKGLHLIVHSFNGAYIGYVTPDKLYDLRKYETRDMNLFGQTGDYFSELIKSNIDFIAQNTR